MGDGRCWHGSGMTSQTPDISGSADFLLERPSALIAALPAMLGFVPEESLVVVTLAGGVVDAVLRRDLDDLDDGTLAAVANLVQSGRPEAAVVVVVSEDCESVDSAVLVGRFSEHLRRRHISLLAGHLVDRVAAGGRWHCFDGCGAAGLVDDPSCSPVTAAAVLAGRPVHARRADLLALVEPSDSNRSSALKARLQQSYAARRNTPVQLRRDVQRVMTAATRLGLDIAPSNRDIVAIVRSLTSRRVRDILCALAISDLAADAEALWMVLSRLLPGPWRAEALVMLGFSAYVRGDGPLTGVALDAALVEDPEHRLGQLLLSALYSGMRPGDIRNLADTGLQLAHELGIAVPHRDIRRVS